MNRLRGGRESYFVVEAGAERLSAISLCWPMMLEYIMKYLLTTVNTLILSAYSDDAVAAVGVAGQVTTMAFVIYHAFSTGAMVSISRNLGAGNKQRAQNLASVAIALTILVSIAFTVLLLCFPVQILRVMQLEEALMDDGVAYLTIVGLAIVFESLTTVISSIARCYGHTKMPMVIMTIMNVINALGSYLVIMRPFEIPLSGVSGVAVARNVSVLVSFAILLICVKKIPLGISLSALRKDQDVQENTMTILKVSIPSGLSSFSYNFSQLVATAILANMGAASVTAMVYVKNIVQYVSVCSSSVSAGYQIIIGRIIGTGNKEYARRLGNADFVLCTSVNTIISLLIVLFRYPLIGIFTDSPEITKLAATVIVIDIIVEFFRAMNHAGAANLVAAGDVKFHMAIGIVSCWVFSVAFSYIFGISLQWGIIGCWLSFCLDEGFRATSYFRRWQGHRWERFATIKRDVQ